MQSKSHSGIHVAIIMDGNGRWATQRGLPRVAGHRAGVSAVRRVVETLHHSAFAFLPSTHFHRTTGRALRKR